MKKIVAIPCFAYLLMMVLVATSVKAQDQTISFPLTFIDGFYTMPLQLADPVTDEVTYTTDVALDTGSSNLLFLGTNCDNCNYRFNKIDKDSVGWQPHTPGVPESEDGFYETLVMKYDEGSVNADWWADAIHIDYGGSGFNRFNKMFGVVYDDPEGHDDKLPNILGLGYEANMTKTSNETTNGYINSFLNKYFSSFSGPSIFSLSFMPDSSTGDDGNIYFGTPTYIPDVYMKVTSSTEYSIQPKTLSLPFDFDLNFSEIDKTIVDSGTTDIVVPKAWKQQIIDQITKILRINGIILHPVNGGSYPFWAKTNEAVMKEALAELGLSINMGNHTYTLDYTTYISLERDSNQLGGTYLSIDISSGEDYTVILGQAFMKGFYTIFDLNTTPNQIGFYQWPTE